MDLPDDSESGDVPGTQALMRGLDVLMMISMAPNPPRFGDIQKGVQLPKGTLHRLLAALQRRRLVRYDARTRQYFVGSRVFDMARRTLDQSDVIRAAKPELMRIAHLLGRVTCLCVRDGGDVFVIDFEDPYAASSPMVRIWPHVALTSSAAGLAMLSALSAEDRADELGDRADGSALEVGLDVSRALGYAIHAPEGGRPSVAAAVLNPEGYPVAALSCPFDAIDASAEQLHEAGRALVEAARRASGNAGLSRGVSFVMHEAPGKVDPRVTPLATGRDFMGENPLWSAEHGKLFWLDILAPTLRSYDPANGETERIGLPEIVGGLALRPRGRLALLGRHGIFEFDPRSHAMSLLISPEAQRPDNRFNTAAVDGNGNLWAGSMAINHLPGRGSFYRIAPDLSVTRVIERTGLPKNAAWSLDGRRLYLSDGEHGVLNVHDVSPAGEVGPGRVFAAGTAATGVPNGICVDADGHVWVAMNGGWALHRYAPDGTLADRVVLPVPMPTNVCFGGPDWRTMYVTSTYLRLPPGLSTLAPLSGAVFAVRSAVPGLPARVFGAGS